MAETEVRTLPGSLPASLAKRACASQLMGIWSVEPRRFATLWGLVQDFGKDVLRARAEEQHVHGAAEAQAEPLSRRMGDVAVVPIGGPMSKFQTSFSALFGGTATTEVLDELKRLEADATVGAILLEVDSPGGTVAGSVTLADFVASMKKPVGVFVDDMAASAAYWVASQADFIVANRAGQIGSIGVYHVLWDESESFANEGIKVIAVTSGGVKGTGIPGTPITPKQVAAIQREVDDIADLFVASVARGRGMSEKQVRALATGEVWIASRALDAGLIDTIGTFEEALVKAKQAGAAGQRKGRAVVQVTTLSGVRAALVPLKGAAASEAALLLAALDDPAEADLWRDYIAEAIDLETLLFDLDLTEADVGIETALTA